MLLSRTLIHTCLVLVLTLSSQAGLAQTKAQLAASIESTQNKLTNNASATETLQRRLDSYTERLVDAEDKLSKAQADLDAANAELSDARNATGDQAQMQQELATRKLDLARNALESRQSRYQSAQRKRAELQLALASSERDAQALSLKLASLKQQYAAAPASPPKAAPKPAQPAPKPALQAKAPAPAPAAVVVAAPVAPVPVATEAVAEAVVEPEPAPVVELTPAQRYAREQMAALNAKIKDAQTDGYRQFEELYVRVRGGQEEEFEFLGNGQYYAEMPLSSGKHKLKIQSRTFVVSVPEAENNQVFTFIYDATNRQKPRFVFFNKALLDD